MRYCDQSFATPSENLACDEALLDQCEGEGAECLRFWEPPQYFVVLGYANKSAQEVNLAFCQERGVPVLRRSTGGGTVLQGPGCLNYTLILKTSSEPELQSIPGTNAFIMKRQQAALSGLLQARVEVHGHTDLAIGGLKFSGNAQRRHKTSLIFHGTFLLELDIEMLEQTLLMPSKQPEYRANRSHKDFLMNLKVPATRIKEALRKAWNASEPWESLPMDQIAALRQQKYERAEWNFKF